MKKIAIMQPYFFPYLGYFQLIDKVDQFLLYGHVDFRRRSFITRNHLVTPIGEVLPINVSTQKAPLGTAIKDIQIADNVDVNKLLRQIRTLYAKSPFFTPVYEMLEQLLHTAHDNILAWNSHTIRGICDYLEMDTILTDNTECETLWDDVEHSVRVLDAPNSDLTVATQRVLKLCQIHHAHHYVNPPGGRSIYSASDFLPHAVELSFIDPDVSAHRPEQQPKLQHASIIDVLMVNGVKKTKELVKLGALN